jgi:hypothetical protein
MTKPGIPCTAAIAALLCAAHVQGQPFKCTGPDGKIVYGDSRCEGPAAKAPGAGEAAKPGSRYELTDADRDRIKSLEAMVAKEGAFSEQKTAAQLQIQNIRRGADARLSTAEREKREALSPDLGSSDPMKRTSALRDIREMYAK